MAGGAGRVRLIALAAAAGILVAGLLVRSLGAGAPAQHAGTALYAAMIYAGVVVLVPRARPWAAAAAALAVCWAVEFLQLTGVPADLAERSLVARLVLGARFDAADLAWYAAGVLPAALLHHAARRR